MRSAFGRTLALAGACAALACPSKPRPSPGAPASAAASASAVARAPREQPLADEQVEIPAGSLRAGTEPGTPGRDPRTEPAVAQVDLGAFRIDRLPYPNTPSEPARTGVAREEALRLCAARGARLCTELEWERACAGPEGDAWPSGSGWDPRCATDPRSCATGFQVLGLGTALREWTASDVRASGDPRAAIRGGGASEAAATHRCSARRALDPTTSAEDLGFRCCRGAPNAAVVVEPKAGTAFRKVPLDAARLTSLLSEAPETRALAEDVRYFKEPDSVQTVIERGPGDKKGFDFTVLPLRWSPVVGTDYLIVTARSGKDTSFVLAYWVLGEDRYRLAASFVLKDEPGPVVLAYSESIRPRMHFSTCWGCPGETGKLLFREPDAVSILQP